jgi:hypothetical protein
VPENYTALGRWVQSQWMTFRKGIMPEYRVQRLNTIGFVWQISVPWMEMYNRLLSYKEQHNGSTKKISGARKLGCYSTFSLLQRKNFKRKNHSPGIHYFSMAISSRQESIDENVPISFDVQEESRNDLCSQSLQSRYQAWVLGVLTTQMLRRGRSN